LIERLVAAVPLLAERGVAVELSGALFPAQTDALDALHSIVQADPSSYGVPVSTV
jgi:hypothetical protein